MFSHVIIILCTLDTGKLDGPLDDGPNDAVGNSASPTCMLCVECEEYYSAMYAKPVTVSETTCSSCGSSCEKRDTECENSNCEICNADCKRCDANCANQKRPPSVN